MPLCGIEIARLTSESRQVVDRKRRLKNLRTTALQEERIMYVQTGKTFFATVIAVVLALGGLAVLSSDAHKDAQSTFAKTEQSASAPAQPESSAYEQTASTNANDTSQSSSYEEGYKSGYRDGHEDCKTSPSASGVSGSSYSRRTYYSRRYYPRRSGV